ncbi:MAG: adenylate/guanylate cyclase domain-containing protein [Bdellovibrionaceae bacterium]|nr:adenylate/guanylate cyclase domain-containing protein [Pseudobdellovibrionaceae bacterium]
MNRHIFSRYRTHIRWGASLVYLLFGLLDYLYAPESFGVWFALRLIFIISVFAIFAFAAKSKWVRNHLAWFAGATLCLACWPIEFMIYQSGGYKSLYATGLILCGTTGLQVFRMRKRLALVSLSLAFLPAIPVYMFSASLETLHLASIQAGFLLGMIALSYIYGASEERVDSLWIRFRTMAKEEIEHLKKTEILKNHFPKLIRESLEKNPGLIIQKKILPNAVVGFADIVSSSAISNIVPLIIDWELKEKFLEAATKRAIQSDMVVLTHLGDGFLFLANYNESSQWYYNIISFYEGLVSDFKQIVQELNLHTIEIETGVKFGVSGGPVIVGFLGKSQSYFTAIGPDVNLAARLCALANVNQIVFSSRVWHSIKPLLMGWDFETQLHSDIKGFDYPISAVRVSPRSVSKNSLICSKCGDKMSLVRTEEGFMDYRCGEGHNTPQLNVNITEIAS